MNGMEIARAYYETYGRPMLEEQFPELCGVIAVGLTGAGSECYGFDDEVSRDHDMEPGFQIFLPGEDAVDRRTAFRLERAYAKLPKEFMGLSRGRLDPVGGSRHGVHRAEEYFQEKTGTPDGCLSLPQWLSTPDYVLAEAVNGEIWSDPSGLVTTVRERLAAMPEDVRRKRLAGQLLLMAQAGQYNYRRCLAHGEEAAAQLAAVEFVKSAMTVSFLLNRRYMPYYKWSFRALRALPEQPVLPETFEYLLTTPNDASVCEDKYFMIEDAASCVIEALQAQELTKAVCGDLEKHAYSVNDGIADPEVRNLHILAAV